MPQESSLAARPRAWVEVDLEALVRNARALERHAQTRLLPMVKADAYGLGAVPVAGALEKLDPIAFGVSSIVEGEELRGAGFTRPIVVFTPTLPRDLERLRRADLTPSLASVDGITRWSALGGGAWHLAIETGMHRAGLDWRAIPSLHDAIRACPPEGAFTHFHSAELDNGALEEQEQRFRAAVDALPDRPKLLHTENSAAIVRRHSSPWDCVRPGVFLYGVGSGETAALQPEPVVHLRAQIVELRDVQAGDTVSYDATWTAAEKRTIATIAVGYGDGYRRHLSNVGQAIVNNRLAPIAGIVTMDMSMLDVTDLGAREGDAVTLLGRAGDHVLTAETVAGWGKMSAYELLTGLRQRLQRVYTGAQ
jgi:alanine racemase